MRNYKKERKKKAQLPAGLLVRGSNCKSEEIVFFTSHSIDDIFVPEKEK